ncbi:MAG: glycogen/starch synthase [Candidatus Izemoplasmatales bacterium]
MNDLFMVVDATAKGSFAQLTRHRMPGALPFGAKYRLVDFTLSNCKNSGIKNVAIFPYGNYRSLADHIGSGERWDLSRRKDGIFILQPKNMNLTYEDAISFQRMYEHQEYFLRSTQEYVVVTSANIVWNIDLNVVLHDHLMKHADVTEVRDQDGKRLNTFIIARKTLLSYVLDYDGINFRNMNEVFDYAPELVRNTYVFESACFLIESPKDLYRADMALLELDVKSQLFNPNRPVYSKETMSSPSRYGEHADIKGAIVASGAVIDGTVINSLIGRKAVVRRGAVVVDSVVMNQCDIGEDAVVKGAILDKETVVLAGAVIEGTADDLFLTEKKQVVARDVDLTVLQVAAECVPYVKTGGLADVVGALAVRYPALGVRSSVMMPLYPRIKEKYHLFLENVCDQIVEYGGTRYKTSLFRVTDNGAVFLFVESYDFFDRPALYGYEDDGDRFAFFAKAAVGYLSALDEQPDVVHVHDWHPGLVPLLLKRDPRYRDLKTVLTVHNVEYQGVSPSSVITKLGIPDYQITSAYVNFLESALYNAGRITTVSPTYRDELHYEYYAKNLIEAFLRRDRDFYGILNGLDPDVGPENDLTIRKRYDASTASAGKRACKEHLQKAMGLLEGEDRFVAAMVTRIAEQKGFDILIAALPEMMADPAVEFVLLGTGEDRYVDALKAIAERYPGRIRLNIGYDSANPNAIYAGADAFLMPSRFEPCGTGQMIALRYGTVPIVRQTGGLNDTVETFDAVARRGNGFKFYNYDARDLVYQFQNAFHLFRDRREDWDRLVQNAMASRFPLEASAKAYVELYKTML